jgi:hypothetical protein
VKTSNLTSDTCFSIYSDRIRDLTMQIKGIWKNINVITSSKRSFLHCKIIESAECES